MRQRLARAHGELTIMRYNTLRSLSGVDGPVAPPEASIAKLYWGTWHRRLGELALDVLGPYATVLDAAPYELGEFQRSFLNSRAETIYGGSNQIQRNIIGERVLGLPPEPKGAASSLQVVIRLRPAAHPAHGARIVGGQGRHRDGGRRARASGRPRPAGAWRKGPQWWCPTPTSGGWPRRPRSWRPRPAGDVPAVACDVTDQGQVRRSTLRPIEHFGRFDVAVHNAGLGGTVPLVEMTDEQWSTVLDITLTGTFRCTRAALTHLLPRAAGSSSTTPRCWAGGPNPDRRTTPRPRPA